MRKKAIQKGRIKKNERKKQTDKKKTRNFITFSKLCLVLVQVQGAITRNPII